MSTDAADLSLFGGVDAHSLGVANLVVLCLRDGPREQTVALRWLRLHSGVTGGVVTAAECLALSQRLDIAEELDGGKVGLTPFGLQLIESPGSPPFNRFNDRQAALLLAHLLLEARFADVASSLLRRFTRRPDGLRELFLSMLRLSRAEVDCLVSLQLLGSMLFQAGALVISPGYYERFSELLGISVASSEADLEEQIALQRLRGKAAEEHVVALERERLEREGKSELALLVQRVSEWDVGAGYDVKSFESDGRQRHIEVKSSTRTDMRFYLTVNEKRFMEEHRDSSWLYFVPQSHLLPDRGRPVLAIADPWSWLPVAEMHATEWSVWIRQALISDDGGVQITVLTR